MTKSLELSYKAMAAGFCIGLAAFIKMSCANEILGTLMFSTGLFFVCVLGLKLFTGRVGYVIDGESPKELLAIWIFNLVGVFMFSAYAMVSNPTICFRAVEVIAYKGQSGIDQMLSSSMLCGAMMFLGVEGYNRSKQGALKALSILLCVTGFIFAGFEHSIANMTYGAMAILYQPKKWGIALESAKIALLCTIGNALGAILMGCLTKFPKEKE